MKVLRTAAAGLLILLILTVPPLLLVRYIGNPWPPEGVTLSSPLTDNAILGLIAVLVWIVWAQFTLSLIVETYAALADQAVDVRLPVFGFQQDLARALVGAVLTTVALTPTVTGAMTTPAAADTTSSTSSTGTSSTGTTARSPQSGPARAPAKAQAARQHAPREAGSARVQVERGETLWSMAEKYLGDGAQWTVIAEDNQGKTMVDGRTFTSADQIRPGWILTIPGAGGVDDHRDVPAEDASYRVKPGDSLSSIAEEQLGDPNAYPAIFAASRGITQPGGKRLTDPDHIEPEWTLTIPPHSSSSEEGRHRSTGSVDNKDDPDRDTAAQGEQQSRATPNVDTQPETEPETETERSQPPPAAAPTTTAAPTTSPETTRQQTPEGVGSNPDIDDVEEDWPITTIGGVGAVLAGLLIGLLARRRAAQRRRRKPGERLPLPDAPAERVETEIRAVADEIGFEFVDQALRSLSAYTVATQTALPQLQTARMTPQQLDLYFSAAPQQPLPTPWQATSDPAVWVLPVDQRHLIDDTDPELPALWPALVSVGHDSENGVILLNLAQLQGLAVTGDHHLTSQVMIALAVELGTAPWAAGLDLTVIGSLVELADVLDRDRLRYVPTSHNVRFEADRVHVVIAMSPLSSEQEQQLLDHGAAVVIQTPALDEGKRQGWSIDLVDAEHATVQPIGLQINPQRVDSATYAAILDMLTSSLADPMRPGQDQVVPFVRGQDADPNPPAPAPAPREPDHPSSRHPSMRARNADTPRSPADGRGDSRGAHDLGHHMVDGNTITATRTAPEPSLTLVEPNTDSDRHEHDYDVVETETEAQIEAKPVIERQQLVDEQPASSTEVVEHPMIRLLGPTVELTGTRTDAPNSESHRRVCTRIATYLALNPDTTRTALIHAIWNGRHVSSSTVDPRISQLRNWLGDNPETGEAYLPRRSLHFTEAVTTDWGQFVDQVGTDPTQATTEALESAVRLIRGRPLEGEQSKHYGFAEYFAQDVIDILADATYELARRRYMAGEWSTAGSAAALGIRVDPGNERLWRLRIHAAHSAGDAAGITEAIDRMHARITELGFELDEQTTELIEAIAGHDDDALHQARQLI